MKGKFVRQRDTLFRRDDRPDDPSPALPSENKDVRIVRSNELR